MMIMKGNSYLSIHRKFQVHSTNMFGLGAEANMARCAIITLLLSLAAYPIPTEGRVVFFFLTEIDGGRNKRFRLPGNNPPLS